MVEILLKRGQKTDFKVGETITFTNGRPPVKVTAIVWLTQKEVKEEEERLRRIDEQMKLADNHCPCCGHKLE